MPDSNLSKLRNNLNKDYPLGLELLVLVALAISMFFAFRYADQPLLEKHSFRQAQTAITSFWFIKDGWRLMYETPVAGAPWAIPFEFPIYQYAVALISKFADTSLNPTGRLIGYFMMLLCVIPVYGITRQMGLRKQVYIKFMLLYLSAPTYLFWGRSFTIESTALFFTLCGIFYGIVSIKNNFQLRALFFVFVFYTLAMLQKATTALPAMAFMCCIACLCIIQQSRDKLNFGRLLMCIAVYASPIMIGAIWVNYTDVVKLLNPLGAELTSNALKVWNWGTLHQRIDINVWAVALWERIVLLNLGGFLGAGALIFLVIRKGGRYEKSIAFLSLALGLSYPLLFINLHYVHDYYQVSNVIFFIFALAVVLDLYSEVKIISLLSGFFLAGIIASNYYQFYEKYYRLITAQFSENSRDVAVGQLLRQEILEGQQFVSFGNDWSASIGYISERKSFNTPKWYVNYADVIANPEHYVESGKLGGVISCGGANPSGAELLEWSRRGRNWKVALVRDCFVATPVKTMNAKNLVDKKCTAGLSIQGVTVGGVELAHLSGRVATMEKSVPGFDGIFLKLKYSDKRESIHEVMKSPGQSALSRSEVVNGSVQNFGLVLSSADLSQVEDVELIIKNKGDYAMCTIIQ